MLTLDEIDGKVRQGLYRPLQAIAAYEASVDGVATGLEAIDKLTGGLRPQRLNIVAGYSHHGKSALMLTTCTNNLDHLPCLYVSGDDTDDMLLTKLIAMREGMTTDAVEQAGPEWRTQYVSSYLAGRVMLAAMKDDYSIEDLAHLLDHALLELGQAPGIICFDYVSLLRLQGSEGQDQGWNIRAKYRALKKLIRDTPQSVWMVGQQCIKAAEDTPALTMNHLEYGGHQDADGVIIGCRRKAMHSMKDEELWEEAQAPKVYVSVMKNKVTGRKSPNPMGRPYLIDPTSGVIREILDSDKPRRPGQAKVLTFPSLATHPRGEL